MYNTHMIERLEAARRSELSKELHMTQLPKKAGKSSSGFGVHNFRSIAAFLGPVSRNLKSWGRSNPAVSSPSLDT
jgi:hypothetical protein